MARTGAAYGFEGGDLYNLTTLGTAPTVDATAARTGNYGLHVNVASNTSSVVQITTGTTGQSVLFTYFAVKFVAIPSVKRTIARFFTQNAAASNLELAIGSDGKLVLQLNAGATIVATGGSALVAGQWYTIEVGLDLRATGGTYVALRLNGQIEINYVQSAAIATTHNNILYLGANSATEASALEMYVDDVVIDLEEWVMHRRIKRLNVASVNTDSANWTLVGAADKASALNTTLHDDDSGFLVSSATITDIITFNLDPLPADAVGIRGMWGRVRIKRDTATASQIQPSWQFLGFTNDWDVVGASAAYTEVLDTGESGRGSPVHPCWDRTTASNAKVRLKPTTAAQTRVTEVYVEVEYSDIAGSDKDIPRRDLIAGFGVGSEEIAAFSGLAAGNVTFVAHPLSGVDPSQAYSAHFAPTGVTAARVEWTGGTDTFVATGNRKTAFLKFDLYVTALPAVSATLFSLTLATFLVRIYSDGSLDATTSTATSARTAAGLIQLNHLHNVQVQVRPASGAAATDGEVFVWVDGVLVITVPSCRPTSSAITSQSQRFGSTTAVAWDYYVSNLITDMCSVPDRDGRLGYLFPAGVGTDVTPAGTWTAVGDTAAWQTIDDPIGAVSDSDTTYVLSPASLADRQSYQTTDVAAGAQTIIGVLVAQSGKANAAGSPSGGPDLRYLGPGSGPGTNSFSNAAYDINGYKQQIARGRGRWTPTLLNSAELSNIVASSVATQIRFTRLFAVYEYLSRTQTFNRNLGMLAMVG